ncbi:copper-binding protein [Bordetella genomosp. 13]|uniref:copper-binding protein n=1 Tax=Bordetella genomosp. 13 TaxID=463040 RepID=UPI0021B6844C|nr:copper-binding protein [Bordetella genomosp. 13]
MKYSFRQRAATAAILAVVAMAPAAYAQQASASGEVRRVDQAGGKVTLKHDAISALELPAMTLVYQADPAMLAGIKPGDKVSFTAERKDGKYVVTKISK